MVRVRWSAMGVPARWRGLVDHARGLVAGITAGLTASDVSWSLREEAEASARLMAHRARMLAAADLYWVSSDMAAIALDASHDVPDWDPTAATSQAGLLLLAKPLPPVRNAAGTGAAPVSGLIWFRDATERWNVGALARTRNLPTTITPETSELATILEVVVTDTPGDVEKATVWSLAGPDAARDQVRVLAWLSAAWRLMAVPTLTSRRQVWPSDPQGGSTVGGRAPEGSPVSLIDLRPLRQVDTGQETDPTTGRIYTHRWVVRGHWRAQPYGPGKALRRHQYIPPYVKGPAGAPMIHDRVNVWRR